VVCTFQEAAVRKEITAIPEAAVAEQIARWTTLSNVAERALVKSAGEVLRPIENSSKLLDDAAFRRR
jgi:hypothetical protein